MSLLIGRCCRLTQLRLRESQAATSILSSFRTRCCAELKSKCPFIQSMTFQSQPSRDHAAYASQRRFASQYASSSHGASTVDAVQDESAEIEAGCVCATVTGVSGSIAEQLGDLLMEFGAQSTMIQEHRSPDRPEQEIFGDGTTNPELWDVCDVVAYFPMEADVDESLESVQEVLQLPQRLSYTVAAVANDSWVQQIKDSYVPLKIDEGLYIVPEWSEAPDPLATNIILQPGVAFGTGEHPTTRLCLKWLLQQREGLSGKRIMDYGSGSGVLAIAALKFGALQAVGVDSDPLAVRSAAFNAGLNGYTHALPSPNSATSSPHQDTPTSTATTTSSSMSSSPIDFTSYLCGTSLTDPEPLVQAGCLPADVDHVFDVVVANILRGPLLELQPRLTGYLRPRGLLAVSGILTEQVPDIMAVYKDECEGFEVVTEGIWALVTAVKR